LQNQPQQNLQNYLSLVYGNPLGRVTNQQSSGPTGFQNALGLAAVGGGLYKNLGSPNLSYINPFSSSFLGGAFNSQPSFGYTNPDPNLFMGP